jgi:hypothetical protein
LPVFGGDDFSDRTRPIIRELGTARKARPQNSSTTRSLLEMINASETEQTIADSCAEFSEGASGTSG